eukprot:gene13643-biopygen995
MSLPRCVEGDWAPSQLRCRMRPAAGAPAACCAYTAALRIIRLFTGVAQCCELNWQLRKEAGPRQVKEARVALQHNLGLGGNVVVTMYKRPEEFAGFPSKVKTSGAMGFPEMMGKSAKL